MGLTIIGAIVGAIVGSLLTWYLQRHWTHDRTATEVAELRKEIAAIREQFANFKQGVETQDKGELEWSERFERLANQLCKINPGLTIRPPGQQHEVVLYPSIFPDAKFREALETYIVQANGGKTQFSQRNPRPDELRRSNLRQTVQKAEQCLTDFQKAHPGIDLNYYMGFSAQG